MVCESLRQLKGRMSMSKENAVLNKEELEEELWGSFDLDELEEKFQSELEEEIASFEFLQEEKEKIGNPDELGKIIMDEVWNQFGNQIGLDMTKETLIQKYDREHPETYDKVSSSVMQDHRYKEANKEMKEKQKTGTLKDEYTGKNLKQGDKANLDHVVSRKELYENNRRKQANLSTEDLANKKENLKATNESLNKSKGAKTVDDYVNSRPEREDNLKKQNERANQKIDDSDLSNVDKRVQKEENDKRLQDKLDADNELMEKADKESRKAINKDIAKGAVKEVGKKAAKDALKQMVVSALTTLLKEVINGMIRFFKSQAKSFKTFLEEMKKSIKSFFENIVSFIHTGVSSVVGTIVSEIFGPIVSTFKRLSSMIKQGVSSISEAIRYLNDKENRNKPFSVKVAQVGKIVTAGLVAGGAMFLGELFELTLTNIPVFKVEIPLLGSLANVIGMFLASLVSGVLGAIIINRIDKFISDKQKADIAKKQLEKGNEIINQQQKIYAVKEMKLDQGKAIVSNTINERHMAAAEMMKESMERISENLKTDDTIDDTLADIARLLDELEAE